MPSAKVLLVPPAGLLTAFAIWRHFKRTPLSKVASTAEIGRLRNESQHQLSSMGNTNTTQSTGGQSNNMSALSTRTLIRLLWQTFNSRHFRGGLRRGTVASLALSFLMRWVMRYFGVAHEWSVSRLACINLATFWFFYYRRHIVEMPVLHFHRDFYKVSLVLRSKISQTPFRPVPWLVRGSRVLFVANVITLCESIVVCSGVTSMPSILIEPCLLFSG